MLYIDSEGAVGSPQFIVFYSFPFPEFFPSLTGPRNVTLTQRRAMTLVGERGAPCSCQEEQHEWGH